MSFSIPVGRAKSSLSDSAILGAPLFVFTVSRPADLFGVTITSDPTFSLHSNAPLAAPLEFATDVPSTARFLVRSADEQWVVESSAPSTNHSIPVFGLAANTEYSIEYVHLDASGGDAANGNHVSLERVERMVDGFPTRETDPNAPTATQLGLQDIVHEFAPDGAVDVDAVWRPWIRLNEPAERFGNGDAAA